MVYRIPAGGGNATMIIHENGDGAGHPLTGGVSVAIDDADNAFVSAQTSNNVFKISPVAN